MWLLEFRILEKAMLSRVMIGWIADPYLVLQVS